MDKTLTYKKDKITADIDIKLRGGKLSISATMYEGRKCDHNMRSAGQCLDDCKGIIPDKLYEIWDRWHLNDMRAGCEHQRANWDTTKEIEIVNYSPTSKFWKFSKLVESGKATAEQYQEFKELVQELEPCWLGYNSPKEETPQVKKMLEAGYLEEGKKEVKSVGWVSHKEHSEGLLSKPCDCCGYAYGTEWLTEELPQDVVEYIEGLLGDK